MTEATPEEVLDFALINRARLDPLAEAARYGIDLNDGLAPGTITGASKQPLAWTEPLNTSAHAHSQSMVAHDYFSQSDPTTNSTPESRAAGAGYNGDVVELIAALGATSGSPLGPVITQQHEILFDDGIRRMNMLSDFYGQIGTGVASGVTHIFGGASNTVLLTEDYGIPPSAGQFITGIAYNDTDANAFYSIGEGRATVSISTAGGNLVTGAAGAYSGAIGGGNQSITFAGGGLASPISLVATVTNGRNVLVNLVDASTIETSTSITEISGVSKIIGLGTIGLTLIGAAGNDTIYGTSGGDTLSGGSGSDTLNGGKGDDTYFVDNVGDVIIENASEGNDIVHTTIAYTLGANVESLILDGTTINGSGNGSNNAIIGNDSNNIIDGKAGSDLMQGAKGDDIYFVDNAGDAIVENLNEGNDIVHASIDYTIGANIESLILDGLTINGAGNATGNAIVGNDADNIIDGRGGGDLMQGGKGNDIYVIDNAADSVVENLNEGNDIVHASIDYTIGANIESLILDGTTINGGGNSTGNAIIGNDSNNIIDGKAGADLMQGGKGNDIYFVDNAGDSVIENLNEGNDIVHATIDYTIGANIESLILDGTANLAGAGNSDGNAIVGNSGNNTLDGRGGQDFLTGNGGNDTFAFKSGEAGGDLVADFTGNGPAVGDSFLFIGFGTVVQGATFTQVGATNQWQIHSGLDGHNEVITLQNGAAVQSTDYLFVTA